MQQSISVTCSLLEIRGLGSVFYSQWGKEPRQTALLSIVTRNIWQFLKSDSILSMDSILKVKDKTQYSDTNRLTEETTAAQIWGLVVRASETKKHISMWTLRTAIISPVYLKALTSRLRIQLATGRRRWGLDWEPSLLPPSQNWPEKTQQDCKCEWYVFI